MKAELNERNEVVVTMSRGESQRLAEIAGRSDVGIVTACDFFDNVVALGVEVYLQE